MRIVDLSKKLDPAKPPLNRRLAIRRFTYEPGEFMYEIDLESHLGTHAEVSSHFMPALYDEPGKDLSQTTLTKFIGNGVFVDLSETTPQQNLEPAFFEREDIRGGDIVIVGNSPYTGADRPQITAESVKWLADKKIKMIGVDDSVRPGPRPPTGRPKSLADMVDHVIFHQRDIPVIEQFAHLDKLEQKRFFFIGLPSSVVGLDSFPIRAIAIEDWPKEPWPSEEPEVVQP